jgi:hypothetical protein
MVVGVLERTGAPTGQSELAGIKIVMYSWKNENGSNMNAMFQAGVLVSKAQSGLK